ncbi:unnamed protein product [Paramecium octaurelia]|uniref:Uncharacterized protein n=1 Tax=Paramecium octaurelia TaxID=43137 RepID=A0A8S1VQL4_PAROT|nr:unnamed protein product [Paramecium octaurelia]
MNSKIKNNQALQTSVTWKYSKKWDKEKYQIVKEKIQITIKNNNKIIYSSSNGEILRIEKEKQNLSYPFILINKDQIKKLQWIGVQRQYNRESVQWSATWCGEVLSGVGGYINQGLKQGVWKELIQHYSCQAKVYEIGEYFNDKKKGIWEFIYNNKKIGSGLYNEKSQKHGKWKELSEEFWDYSQVIFQGEYLNGRKIGRWDILQEDGGGSYDEMGNCNKIGLWIELSDGFWNKSQVLYRGQYKNGKRVGRWDIVYRYDDKENLYFNKLIGGGFYAESSGLKVGQWIELSDGFWFDQQVTLKGEYQNGKKVGRWNINYNNRSSNKNNQMQQIKLQQYYSGGGFYDEKGDGSKIGKWIELDNEFWLGAEITYQGEYKNGIKIGLWDILYKNRQMQIEQIEIFSGGGFYDSGCQEIKVGKWIELYDGFCDDLQVIYNGVYQIGKKIGRWDILYRKLNKFEIIAGGSYHQQGNEVKVGKWTELGSGFKTHSQITSIGQYKNSKKVGRWDIYWNWFGNNLIGGGSYDELGSGMKIGRWIDIGDQYRDYSQITYSGDYKNGSKIGKWDIFLQRIKQELIGGGQYSSGEDGIKNGRWTEVHFEFNLDLQLTYSGEYKNSKKIGRWDTYYRDRSQGKFEKIGGGQYSEIGDGFKIGKWIELSDEFQSFKQISYVGEYNNNKKVGRWDVWYQDYETKINEQIGGGFYDEKGNGVKIGNWIELCEGFKKCKKFSKEITYNGEYKNDRKFGKWNIMYREWDKANFNLMQLYNKYSNLVDMGIMMKKVME